MALSAKEISTGDQYQQEVVNNLSRTQIVQYAGASGDYNPLHTDDLFAKEIAGYPTVFAHGMLTMGLTARMVTDYVGDGRLLKYGVRFKAQVWPGDTLTARATVGAVHAEAVDLEISTVNQDGVEVLSGHATARIDP